MLIEVKEEQSLKAELPILVTLLGMLTEVKEEQYPKAQSPILVTEYELPSYITEDGIVIVFTPE